jgi:hypothetical protein
MIHSCCCLKIVLSSSGSHLGAARSSWVRNSSGDPNGPDFQHPPKFWDPNGPLKSIPSSVDSSRHCHRLYCSAPPAPQLTPPHCSASDSYDSVVEDPCCWARWSFPAIQRWYVDPTSAKTFTAPPSPKPPSPPPLAAPPSPLRHAITWSAGLHAARSTGLDATHHRPPLRRPPLRFCSQVLEVPPRSCPLRRPTMRRLATETVLLRLMMASLISRARFNGGRRLRHSSSRARILVCLFNLCSPTPSSITVCAPHTGSIVVQYRNSLFHMDMLYRFMWCSVFNTLSMQISPRLEVARQTINTEHRQWWSTSLNLAKHIILNHQSLPQPNGRN